MPHPTGNWLASWWSSDDVLASKGYNFSGNLAVKSHVLVTVLNWLVFCLDCVDKHVYRRHCSSIMLRSRRRGCRTRGSAIQDAGQHAQQSHAHTQCQTKGMHKSFSLIRILRVGCKTQSLFSFMPFAPGTDTFCLDFVVWRGSPLHKVIPPRDSHIVVVLGAGPRESREAHEPHCVHHDPHADDCLHLVGRVEKLREEVAGWEADEPRSARQPKPTQKLDPLHLRLNAHSVAVHPFPGELFGVGLWDGGGWGFPDEC